MRKSIVLVLTAAALSLPSTEALAGGRGTVAAPRKRVSTVAKSFTGSPGSAGKWGEVQITIVVEKKTTTVGKKTTVTRRMVAIRISRLPEPHGPVDPHQPAGSADPHPGSTARSKRQDRHPLGCDLYQPGLRRIALRCACEGARVVAAAARVPHVEHVMGMPIIVDIRDPDFDTGCVDAVFAWFRLVDEVFSTYKPASEISRLNRGEIGIHDVSEDIRDVLERCEELRSETDGYFDVRAASGEVVDPSGFVKGWSVDRATSLLDGVGARNYSINAGGDIAVRGGALPQRTWRIGIQHPKRRDSIAKVLQSDHLAVATSGSYERGPHVVNPRTGLAPTGVLSVTVTGPSSAPPMPTRRPGTHVARRRQSGRASFRRGATRH